MPLLSIIVPVYNVEMYLAESLDSLLAQTFKNMEIICVNDGSTDDSGAILNRYAAQYPELITVITQKNKGQGAARNAGMAVASGTFITFVDSDDLLVPHAYETALACFTDDVDSVYFGIDTMYDMHDIYDTDLEQIKKNIEEYNTVHSPEYGIKTTIDIYDESSWNVYVWNKIYRTSVLKKSNLTFWEGRFREDDLFNYCFFAVAPKTFLLPKKLYIYRIHPNSCMANVRKGKSYDFYLDSILILRKMYDFYRMQGLFPDHAEQFTDFFRKQFKQFFSILNRHDQTRVLYELYELFKNSDLPLRPVKNDIFYLAASGFYTLQFGRNTFAKKCLKAVWQLIYSWNKTLAALPFNSERKEILRNAYRLARMNIKELNR